VDLSPHLDRLRRALCCRPPSQVTGLEAQTGAGSGEVFVAWNRNPASEHIAFYRVYRRVATGIWRHLAAVTEAATDANFPGKVAMLDFEGNFPGGSDFGPGGERTYVVSAISRAGLEGPVSSEVVGTPP
jgi:hypothetical protein